MMRVLAACEFSGRVRDAFRNRGHDAWSCDITPGQGEHDSYHIQDDVIGHLEGWDMVIGFPPCTYLTTGGNGWQNTWRDSQTAIAVEFVRKIAAAPAKYVAIENPQGRLSTLWRKPDQTIEPFWFGDPWMKRTCLWLSNLPLLYIDEEYYCREPVHRWVSSGGTTKNKVGGGTRNVTKRSLTFPGIARAMAMQWGVLPCE